jgi:hypothetical protein
MPARPYMMDRQGRCFSNSSETKARQVFGINIISPGCHGMDSTMWVGLEGFQARPQHRSRLILMVHNSSAGLFDSHGGPTGGERWVRH